MKGGYPTSGNDIQCSLTYELLSISLCNHDITLLRLFNSVKVVFVVSRDQKAVPEKQKSAGLRNSEEAANSSPQVLRYQEEILKIEKV